MICKIYFKITRKHLNFFYLSILLRRHKCYHSIQDQNFLGNQKMNKTLSSLARLLVLSLTFLASCKTSSLNLKESHTQHVGVNAKPAEAPPAVLEPTPTYVPGTPAGLNRFVDKIARDLRTRLSSYNVIDLVVPDLVVPVTIAIRPIETVDMNLYKSFIEAGINKWLEAIQKANTATLSSLKISITWVDQRYNAVNYNDPNNSFWHSALCNPTEENRYLWNGYNLVVFIMDLFDAPPNCAIMNPDAQFPAHDTSAGHAGIGGGFIVLNLASTKRLLKANNIINASNLPESLVRFIIEHELGHVFGATHLEGQVDPQTGQPFVDPQTGQPFCIWDNVASENFHKSLMCSDPDNISKLYLERVVSDPINDRYNNLPLTEVEKQMVWNHMNAIMTTIP